MLIKQSNGSAFLTISKIKNQDLSKMAITEEIVTQPTPRVHASMVYNPIKTNEFVLFGGEFFDGQTTMVYQDLYRYNIVKKEWKKVSSSNQPPPRCSHQAVV